MLAAVSRAWVMVMTASMACAPLPAERLHRVRRLPEPVVVAPVLALPTRAIAARPEVDLSAVTPSLDEEGRWPLAGSSHPTLDPRYPIASALAEPGLGWVDLCRIGIQGRHAPTAAGQEQLEYLRGWCSVANHDVDAAVGYFATLAHPVVSGLRAAVTLDFANVLADGCPSGQALHLLDKHTVVAPEVFDTLAATYLEVERPDDAREVNLRALQGVQQEPATCHRRVREIALARQWEAQQLATKFADQEEGSSDPTCQQLRNLTRCWAEPTKHCEAYFKDQGINLGYVHLFSAYFRWPAYGAEFSSWLEIANDAVVSIPLPGADTLAVAALETALQSSQCHDDRVGEIEILATRMINLPHEPLIRAHLLRLISIPDCEARVQRGVDPPSGPTPFAL